MSLLDKLWDDTVAGPQPESGLSRLRKHHLCSNGSGRSPDSTVPITWEDEAQRVSQPIAISKTANFRNHLTVETGSTPASPAGSNASESPFSWTPRGSSNRFSRKSMDEGQSTMERAEPRSPTVYDWIVISALDG